MKRKKEDTLLRSRSKRYGGGREVINPKHKNVIYESDYVYHKSFGMGYQGHAWPKSKYIKDTLKKYCGRTFNEVHKYLHEVYKTNKKSFLKAYVDWEIEYTLQKNVGKTKDGIFGAHPHYRNRYTRHDKFEQKFYDLLTKENLDLIDKKFFVDPETDIVYDTKVYYKSIVDKFSFKYPKFIYVLLCDVTPFELISGHGILQSCGDKVSNVIEYCLDENYNILKSHIHSGSFIDYDGYRNAKKSVWVIQEIEGYKLCDKFHYFNEYMFKQYTSNMGYHDHKIFNKMQFIQVKRDVSLRNVHVRTIEDVIQVLKKEKYHHDYDMSI